MSRIVALYGSPRRNGNTATLLSQAIRGARDAGAEVESIVLRDKRISPCLEIYGCKEAGECAIRDDFQEVRDRMLAADGLIIATPVFFYTVSAHLKLLMDRCQSLWVKKYWIDQTPYAQWTPRRKALVIAAGATRGKKLFDGLLLTMKYFLDVFDAEVADSLLFRGLDFEGDALAHPEFLEQAYRGGHAFAEAVMKAGGAGDKSLD